MYLQRNAKMARVVVGSRHARTSLKSGHSHELGYSVRSTAVMTDEGAFVFNNRTAGYGAEPPPERPTDDACERRLGSISARCVLHTMRCSLTRGGRLYATHN